MPRSLLDGHTCLNLSREHIESVNLNSIISLGINQQEVSIFLL